MFRKFSIPSSFSLIQKGKVYLLLKDQYKDLLLQEGIDQVKDFLQKHRPSMKYLSGRTLHPSIPLNAQKRVVIRRYLHGGIFRLFTRDLYLFGTRSFEELALTQEIIACGISTIEPVGAIHQRFPPFYRAYLLSLEISEAIDLIQYFLRIDAHASRERLLCKRKTIRSAGLLIRQFHQAGFFHGDLQLKNILVSGDRLFLIDFDHSYRKPVLSMAERMKNLHRLNRSVEKWKRSGLPITWRDRMRFFLAYAGDERELKEEIRRVFRTYAFRRFLYRWSWAVQRVLNR